MTKAAKPAKKPARPATVDPVAAMREAAEYYKAHPEEGRALLVQAGIYTKAGKLTKAYGG